MSQCILDCNQCSIQDTSRYCCSQFCIQDKNEDFGYCKNGESQAPCNFTTGESTTESNTVFPTSPSTTPVLRPSHCIANCDECRFPGGTRFCCSGFCLQIQGNSFGYCSPKETEPPCTEENIISSGGGGSGPTTTTTPPTPVSFSLQILPYLVGGLIAVLLIGIFLWYRQTKKRKEPTMYNVVLSSSEIKQFLEGKPESAHVNKPAHEFIDDVPYDRRYEISEKSFTVDEMAVLGSGAFGIVLKGRLWNQDVALKTTKPNVEKMYIKSLLTELKLLIYLGEHENIVNLLGAFTTKLKSGTLYVFLELCPFGNLISYLRSNRDEYTKTLHSYQNIQADHENFKYSISQLLNWSVQIANGLRFLSDKKVIHGDIAARNVLVFSDRLVKLTDFGLSRRLYEYTNYVKKQQEPLPWRWMSIESLRELSFSTQSDVWSFGVTLWEIFTLGDVPYPGLSWSQDFIYKVTDGLRLPKPSNANDDLYEEMNKCWQLDPKSRPNFYDLYRNLKDIAEGKSIN